MAALREQDNYTPTDAQIRVHHTFLDNLNASKVIFQSSLLEELTGFNSETEGDSLANEYTEAMLRNQIVFCFGSELYERHMGQVGRDAMRRPFGIEMGTLLPHVKLVLSPYMAFGADEQTVQLAEEAGVTIVEDGPQAILYYLDESAEKKEPVNFVANFSLFMPTMSLALINGAYPLEQGERSPEFQERVESALDLVRRYVNELPEDLHEKLSPSIAAIGMLGDEGLKRYATDYVRYQAEPMKMPGLRERSWFKKETPKEAIEQGTEHLHVSVRNLPLRSGERDDTPALPWREYAINRYNRDRELFGRYEHPDSKRLLRVDYALDTTHMPEKYGFFHELEIMEMVDNQVQQHVILGYEDGNPIDPNSVFPIIVAGEYDFQRQRAALQQLAKDPGTKPEIARVIADILALHEQGRLQTVD